MAKDRLQTSLNPLLGDGLVRARKSHVEPLHAASWLDSTLVFDHRRWTCEAADLRWTAPYHLIVLTERGRTSRTRVRCAGEIVYDGSDQPGALTFVPAGAERSGAYRNADLYYSALWIAPTLELAERSQSASRPVFVNKRDPVIASLLTSLRIEMSTGHKPQTAYVEHLAALVMLRIAAMDGSVHGKPRSRKLGAATLQRIRDFIEAHISSDLSLHDLAAVAGMRVDSFARSFKASTGRAPYAYVLDQRLQHAERLLATSHLSIATIALAAGFSSQSHLTSTLRRLRGTTPRSYRAQLRPES